MNKITFVHPQKVYEALLLGASHPTKRRNLKLIHEICEENKNKGGKEFSLKFIGGILEQRGGPKVKALWNVQSGDYRKLIEAWEAYAGEPKLKETEKVGEADFTLRNIADPATRIVVEQLIRERNALRSEVNILKASTKLVIDKRPVIAARGQQEAMVGDITLEISTGPKLNVLEREALEHAVSPSFWKTEGWKEDKNGRLIRDLGEGRTRTILRPGFVTAVRKILDAK